MNAIGCTNVISRINAVYSFFCVMLAWITSASVQIWYVSRKSDFSKQCDGLYRIFFFDQNLRSNGFLHILLLHIF